MKSHLCSLILILSLSPVLWCCKAQQQSEGMESRIAPSSKILFINLKIRREKRNDTYKVSLINTKTVAGTFKEVRSDPDTAGYLNYLVCSFSEKEGTVLKTVIIEHPLFRRFEFENSDRQLVTRTVNLDSAEFSLRIICPARLNFLSVSQVINKGAKQYLGSLNINCNEIKR